jgi:hypothetical protein
MEREQYIKLQMRFPELMREFGWAAENDIGPNSNFKRAEEMLKDRTRILESQKAALANKPQVIQKEPGQPLRRQIWGDGKVPSKRDPYEE